MLTSHPVTRFGGIVRAPGDKSCSHRALILSGLAVGTSQITGLLDGDDVLCTANVMAALGAEVQQLGPGNWQVTGVGPVGLTAPRNALDFGNSGTGVRLMMGVLAGYDLTAELIGDQSLSARPMGRVTRPLTQMGAIFAGTTGGKLPMQVTGRSPLKAIDYAPPEASAQVKSALLFAGLNAEGTTRIREIRQTRDHTERMLAHFGGTLASAPPQPGAAREIAVTGGQTLSAAPATVPGDPSSAAFLAAGGLISPAGNVLIEGIMSNETRDGFFQAASAMGADLGAEDAGNATGERLIDLQALSSMLRGRPVAERLVPAMIDEFPILAVLAAFATGVTEVTGAAELRVKESDRIGTVVAMLRANGVNAEERPDGFIVEGCAGPPPGGGHVETRHDHRIAMSALVMGTATKAPVSIDDASMIATSYPEFLAHMRALGADIR